MTDPDDEQSHPARARGRSRQRVGLVLAVIVLACGTGWWLHSAAHERLQRRLLESLPDAVAADAALVKAAVAEARPLYSQHCASCHGPTMQGNAAIGAPNLTDTVWLYGDGSVFEIERTVMYGARSSLPKGHNTTDMPPFGLMGILSPSEIRDVVQYVLQLSGRPHDAQAALAGARLYVERANCADCHGPDGKGNPSYGAPDLTVDVWNSGGDPETLYKTLYYGQHHVMPGWLGTLSLEQIRALAVYVYVTSHQPGPGKPSTTSYVAADRAEQ